MSNSNMTYHDMKQAILQGLLLSGWNAVDEISMNHTSAMAKKSFQTAVGERTALAYFTDSPDECCKLSGDGFDYSSILPADPRVVYAVPGLHTGPAAARNRALDRATGSHVCMMDADDSVSGLFLAILRPRHASTGSTPHTSV